MTTDATINPPTTAPKARTRCVWTPEERAAWLSMFEASGKTVAEFCRENGLAEATLSLWRRKPREAADTDGNGALVEIPLAAVKANVPAALEQRGVQIRLGNGIELDVEPGTDLEWLTALLRGLACSA